MGFRFRKRVRHRGDSWASTRIDRGVSRIFRFAVLYFLTSRNGKNRTFRPSKDHSTKRER
jgi:hypothetical protein